MPAIDQFERAANLDGIVRGNQDQRVIFQRIGERGVGAIVARARHAARILVVDGFGFGAPIGVQPHLANVADRAHQRAWKTCEIADRLQRNRNGDRRFHDQIAVAFAG